MTAPVCRLLFAKAYAPHGALSTSHKAYVKIARRDLKMRSE